MVKAPAAAITNYKLQSIEMLKLKLTRIARKKGYTIGRLLIQTCSRTRDRSRGRSYATRSNPVAQPQKGEVWNSLKTLNRLLAILQRRKKGSSVKCAEECHYHPGLEEAIQVQFLI